MSRGFVKEGDQEETPFVPPRAYLPPGVTNYVTPAGYEALMIEKESLMREKELLQSDNDTDRRVEVNFINAKLQLLEERINTARIIRPADQPHDEIRFGAIVELETEGTNEIQTLQLTGVDEANISKGKLSFLSPLARALVNKKAGDKVLFKRATGAVVLIIRSIKY